MRILKVKAEPKSATAKRSKKTKNPKGKTEKPREKQAGTRQQPSQDEGFFGKSEQLGATFSKGLDLAEAGLSLGLTLVNRFGTMVQDSVLEKFSGVMAAAASPNHQETSMSSSSSPDRQPPEPVPQDPDEPVGQHDLGTYIVNRLPVAPGQQVSVSFSINNDSLDAVKHVKIRVEGFTGGTQGQAFSSKGFSVSPASKAIAPMDFEKFILKGKLPAGVPPDVYEGRIVVIAEQAFEIPVKLLVTSGGVHHPESLSE